LILVSIGFPLSIDMDIAPYITARPRPPGRDDTAAKDRSSDQAGGAAGFKGGAGGRVQAAGDYELQDKRFPFRFLKNRENLILLLA
jgi:hypothetical protein